MTNPTSIGSIKFEGGTLVTDTQTHTDFFKSCGFVEDKRTSQLRAPGYSYREALIKGAEKGFVFDDLARSYESIELDIKQTITPRPHQTEALDAWENGERRGVVSLPTGAGKTILAIMAMQKVCRPTLIVVPTIDLLIQWQMTLEEFFGNKIGGLGGGQKDLESITVSTYDTAHLMMETIGNKFGFLIIDECHHLPAPQYQLIAKCCIAPYRLGLSATVERADGGEEIIYDLLGDKVFDGQIKEMGQGVLAPYEVVTIKVSLSEQERQDYDAYRKIYTDFIKRHGINFGRPDGWMQFLIRVGRSPGGKQAFAGYRAQKKLAQASRAKIGEVWRLLKEHNTERIIIFTDNNDLAYTIGRCFLLPVLTHQTKSAERKKFLEKFRAGELDVLVTSKVLNEGVDVPEASVGIVVSGGGGVREHVQRLGRILRHKDGKTAYLYEIISQGTGEQYVNKRRKEHNAYKRSY